MCCSTQVQFRPFPSSKPSEATCAGQVLEISRDQIDHFCGNVIEVRTSLDQPILAMSTAAHNAFTPDQRRELLRHVRRLCHAPFDTIEHIGGGGVRCAIAEIF